jgi:tripartite-type tricarboxylate transporter receptor subunit TctC
MKSAIHNSWFKRAGRVSRALRSVGPAACLGLSAVWTLGLGLRDAASAEDFYKGKNITLFIWTQAGSGYDTIARAVGRHLGKHIPGTPNIVPSNMLGGGGLVLANYLYNIGPKDGTAIAMLSRSNMLDAVLGNPVVKFDPRKFNWIGVVSPEAAICVAWHAAGFKTWEDLKKKEFIAAASGITADNGSHPLLFNALLGTKYKVVVGYKGGPDMNKAMEDGEANGRCGWSWTAIKTTKANWLAEKKINVLLQAGLEKSKELPDVPLVLDLVSNPEDKQAMELAFGPQAIAWPIVAGPGIPVDRVAMLRKAFMDTMKDKEFLAEAKRMRIDVDPISAQDAQKVIERMYAASKESIAKLRPIMVPIKKEAAGKGSEPMGLTPSTISGCRRTAGCGGSYPPGARCWSRRRCGRTGSSRTPRRAPPRRPPPRAAPSRNPRRWQSSCPISSSCRSRRRTRDRRRTRPAASGI